MNSILLHDRVSGLVASERLKLNEKGQIMRIWPEGFVFEDVFDPGFGLNADRGGSFFNESAVIFEFYFRGVLQNDGGFLGVVLWKDGGGGSDDGRSG